MGNIDYFIVLIASLVNIGIGALWYSPYLFGKHWARLLGVNLDDNVQMEKMRKSAKYAYVIVFINTFIMGITLASILYNLSVETTGKAIWWALVLWAGFIVTTSLTNNMFTKRPKKVWLIDVCYHAVAFIAMAVILMVFR